MTPLVLVASTAAAEPTRIEGYISPRFDTSVQPTAVPEDRVTVGLGSSRLGLDVRGEPLDAWTWRLYLSIDAALVQAASQDAGVLGEVLQDTSIGYQPHDALALKVGVMRIPLTAANLTPDTMRLLPDRIDTYDVVLLGSDLGAQAVSALADRRLQLTVGAYNGTGLAAGLADQRGLLTIGRVDVFPLGDLDDGESSTLDDPFRFGLGVGAAYHPFTSYDAEGYPDVDVRDTRVNCSARATWAGLSLQSELRWRTQTDSLTNRPVQADAAYVQAGWRLPASVEPMVRLARATTEKSYDPQLTAWSQVGANGYLGPHDDVKLTLSYTFSSQKTMEEVGHGIIAQVQVRWSNDVEAVDAQ